jgi:leucoanthocyanidin reductase
MTAPATAKNNSKVLIVGATGFMGRFVAEAIVDSGRPTFILVRPDSGNPSKANAVDALQKKGAITIYGLVNDKESMVKTLKENEIEVVISAVGGEKLLDQIALIEAIKEAGIVKRFLPSEFGHDVDRADPVEPGLTMYRAKRRIRRAIEDFNIPYTYICCNSIASWPYCDNTHPSEVLPPLDQFRIYGDGNVKAYFVAGADIGKFTLKTIDDIRTVNKLVHFRPSCNCFNMNELASLWEEKIGRTLPRSTITEEDLLAAAAENCIPRSVVAALTHDIFIKGCQTNFAIEGPKEVEVNALYPEESFKTLDECFTEFAHKIEKQVKDEEIATKNPVVEPIAITATCS